MFCNWTWSTRKRGRETFYLFFFQFLRRCKLQAHMLCKSQPQPFGTHTSHTCHFKHSHHWSQKDIFIPFPLSKRIALKVSIRSLTRSFSSFLNKYIGTHTCITIHEHLTLMMIAPQREITLHSHYHNLRPAGIPLLRKKYILNPIQYPITDK